MVQTPHSPLSLPYLYLTLSSLWIAIELAFPPADRGGGEEPSEATDVSILCTNLSEEFKTFHCTYSVVEKSYLVGKTTFVVYCIVKKKIGGQKTRKEYFE